MARLVADYGSDRNAQDLARVLRLPGFYHRKGKPHLVKVDEDTGKRYARADLLKAFPPVPAKAPAAGEPKRYSVTLPELRSALEYICALGRMVSPV
jgi:hypothetical protein